MNRILATLLLCMGTMAAFAQDKIYTRLQKAPIECEVTEVGVNEIKYKPVGHPIPIVTMDKQDVIKIVYQSGEVMMINNPLKDYTMYADQHKWNIKLDLLSPVLGYTGLFLEQSKKPGRSLEYNLNIIGLGKNQYLQDVNMPGANQPLRYYMDAKGAGLGIGIKFVRLPDYINGQVRLRHILQGSYIKPAIGVSAYSRNFITQQLLYDSLYGYYYTANGVKDKFCFSINPNITFGRQWIFDNTVSLEMYFNVGFSYDNVRSNQQHLLDDAGNIQSWLRYDTTPFNSFGYTRFSSGDFGLSLMAGLRVGYLFDWKKSKDAGK